MKNQTIKSTTFFGSKISDYGLAHGYVDYHALACAFDAVLVNDITKLFYANINGEYNEPEQVNGYIDNSDEIDAKREQIEILEDTRDNSEDDEQIAYIDGQIAAIEDDISELEREQDEQPDIYQYYIISHRGADILIDYTNEIVYYLPALDCYIWGITHFGTGWTHVLTNIKIELSED